MIVTLYTNLLVLHPGEKLSLDVKIIYVCVLDKKKIHIYTHYIFRLRRDKLATRWYTNVVTLQHWVMLSLAE